MWGIVSNHFTYVLYFLALPFIFALIMLPFLLIYIFPPTVDTMKTLETTQVTSSKISIIDEMASCCIDQLFVWVRLLQFAAYSKAAACFESRTKTWFYSSILFRRRDFVLFFFFFQCD